MIHVIIKYTAHLIHLFAIYIVPKRTICCCTTPVGIIHVNEWNVCPLLQQQYPKPSASPFWMLCETTRIPKSTIYSNKRRRRRSAKSEMSNNSRVLNYWHPNKLFARRNFVPSRARALYMVWDIEQRVKQELLPIWRRPQPAWQPQCVCICIVECFGRIGIEDMSKRWLGCPRKSSSTMLWNLAG